MQPQNNPADSRQDVLIVENPEAIRLLFSEKHSRILRQLTESELSISDIARSLGINPGSAHYHLKELEKQGLVRQVRQEIKGGIVKKYYRSTARRICLESPDFDDALHLDIDLSGEPAGRLIRAMEPLGYSVAEENYAEAREVLFRYDRRMKEICKDVYRYDFDDAGVDGTAARQACMFLVNMRVINDPELASINTIFSKLFSRIE